jgi:hypothetical protein
MVAPRTFLRAIMTKGKTTRKTTRRTKKTSKAKTPKTLQEARQQLQDLVKNNSGDIAVAVIDEAKKGKYLPAKFLFEAVKLCEAPPAEEKTPEKTESLERLLLEQWQLKPPPPDDDVTDGSGAAEEEPVTVG